MEHKKIKILVMDDYEDILIETREILERYGFEVFTAPDTKTALEIFQKEKPPLCLIDVIICDKDSSRSLFEDTGFSLISKLREINPRAKFVAFASNCCGEKGAFLGKEFGADEVIDKTSGFTDIKAMIDKLNILAFESSF